MHKKLTITLDEDIYKGLHEKLGPRRISHFIEDLIRPYLENADLDSEYRQMSEDVERENEALIWIDA
jgi:predicted CopG family antitoxin